MGRRAALLGTCLLAAAGPRGAHAFSQPPVNLSATSFLDGGPLEPGLYLVEYVQYADLVRAKDRDGNLIPGGARVSSLANLNQLFYLSRWKLLWGRLGFDALLPLVGASGSGALGAAPVTAGRAGAGDLFLAPALQWNQARLLGRPFAQRVEIGVTLPTGLRNPALALNPGAGLLTIEPYYAFSWHFAGGWETSWRFFYAVHGENDGTKVRPGQLFHLNYALSRALGTKFRLGAAGNFLRQTTEDQVGGVRSNGSKERAFAVGPAFGYLGDGLALFLSHVEDLTARNRFRASRTTLQMVHRF